MSATKLLVLGIVHLSGGAHGYQVRSELQSWRSRRGGRDRKGAVVAHRGRRRHAAQALRQTSRTEM